MLRSLFVILFLFCASKTFADELSLGSVLNFHTIMKKDSESVFKNKVTDSGFIVSSPMFLQVRIKNISMFTTTECLGQVTYGAYYNFSLLNRESFKLDFVTGFYTLQTENWKKDFSKYWVDVSDNVGLAGIIGVKADYNFYKKDNFRINGSFNLTPALVQTGLFLTVEF